MGTDVEQPICEQTGERLTYFLRRTDRRALLLFLRDFECDSQALNER